VRVRAGRGPAIAGGLSGSRPPRAGAAGRRLARAAVRAGRRLVRAALPATPLLAAAVLAAAPGCSQAPAPAAAAAAAAAENPAAASGTGSPAAGESGPSAGGESAEPAPPDDAIADAGGAAADAAPEKPADDPTVVTISPSGGTRTEPRTLAEAAQAARERRGDRPTATTVITNENLAEYAARGQVTLVPDPAGDPGAAPAGSDPASGAAAAGPAAAGGAPTGGPGDPGGASAAGDPADDDFTDAPAGPRDEAYWRDRARELRARWAAAAEEIERLETETADLRWAFYAEDDPYYRDERIKPAWDRALDDLRRARQDERAFRQQVTELMEEGRRAGALPGWLREGVELEPEEAAETDSAVGREPRTSEPIEPPAAGEERPR